MIRRDFIKAIGASSLSFCIPVLPKFLFNNVENLSSITSKDFRYCLANNNSGAFTFGLVNKFLNEFCNIYGNKITPDVCLPKEHRKQIIERSGELEWCLGKSYVQESGCVESQLLKKFAIKGKLFRDASNVYFCDISNAETYSFQINMLKRLGKFMFVCSISCIEISDIDGSSNVKELFGFF